jgi:hypothetical protein
MKLVLTALAALSVTPVMASNTLDVRGTTYEVDTIFHAKVGPGTTQTQLELKASSSPLQVYYLTVDMTTPNLSIRTVCANDKVASTARTSVMAQSKSKDGVHYFAGTNGDFFATSGSASNGTSKVGTPTCTTICDREIFKTSNSNYQFTYDLNGVMRISRLNYYTGTATIGEKVTLFKGVNVMSPNNGLTIYTPRFWGSANQGDYADNSYQVTAKLVEGDEFLAGGKFRLEVTSEPTTDGDAAVPSDGYVIFGRGTSKTGCNTGAINFVKALKVGDIVSFDNIILTSDGEQIYPSAAISGNPKNVGLGETLDTESERTDASARHPRTCIGFNQDQTKLIMMVIDGRISTSVGVTTSMLADVMRYAGAYEAVNLDGGGSSTLYTEALGVRNHCSDGNERAVGNAVFAVLDAPEDEEVAEIQFMDWKKTMPGLSKYTPVIYAYNKYGRMISTDFKGYKLSCPAEAGTISEDGLSLIAAASGSGLYALTATYNGYSTSIPVRIDASSPLEPKYSDILIDASREWDAELQSLVDGVYMPVLSDALTWTSSNSDIVTVTPEGTVKGVQDGTATITGVRGDLSATINVTVQVPHKAVMAIADSADEWSTSNISLSDISIAQLENGVSADYSIKSTRGPKLTLSLKKDMWSLPEAVQIRLKSDLDITTALLTLKAANDTRTVQADTQTAEANKDVTLTFKLSDVFDTNDIGIYPVQFTSLGLSVSASTIGSTQHMDIPGIEAVYDESHVGVTDIVADNNSMIHFEGDQVIFSAEADAVTVVDMSGRVVANADRCHALTLPSAPGVYVISATVNALPISAKIIR